MSAPQIRISAVTLSRTRDYFAELIREGVTIAEGANRNRVYRLK